MSIPMKKAMKDGYHSCLNLDLLCEIYGCTIDDLSVEFGEGQNKIYYDKWQWNIAYENPHTCDSAWYGNPFYDMFSNEGGYQWMHSVRNPNELKDYDWTPEELIRILNAFTEIMEWKNRPEHAQMLSKMSKLVFENTRDPQTGQQFQDFLADRKKALVIQGKW